MRNSLFLLAFLCLSTSLFAQQSIDISEGQSYLDGLFSELHQENVPSGILYGQSMIGFSQTYFEHWEANDSTLHTSLSAAVLYRSMYENRSVNNTWLQEASLTSILANSQINSSVELIVASFNYNELSIEAAENGLVTNQANTLQITSGYTINDILSERKAHAIIADSQKALGKSITFNLPSANILGNNPISAVALKAENGAFVDISFESSLTIEFSSLGMKTIVIKATGENGESYYSTIILELIKENSLLASSSTRNPHEGFACPPNLICREYDNGNLQATVQLACGQGNYEDIKKPFIILDGIDLTWDLNAMSAEVFFTAEGTNFNFDDDNFLPEQSLGEFLSSNKFDVIFIDYLDHHRSIVENSAAVQEFLLDLESIKKDNGSVMPSQMAAFSMGGIVGMHALLSMEENGEDHGVSKYITFDSPIQGANISLGLQGLIHQLANIVEDNFWLELLNVAEGDIGESILGIRNVLLEDAPQQLLLFTANSDFLSSGFNNTHLDFYNDLNHMGINGDRKLHHCEYLAISNGNGQGGVASNQDVEPASHILEFKNDDVSNAGEAFLAQLTILQATLNGEWQTAGINGALLIASYFLDWELDVNVYAAPGVEVPYSSENKIFDSSIKINLFVNPLTVALGLNTIESVEEIRVSEDMPHIDSAPGGIINIGQIIVNEFTAGGAQPNVFIEDLNNSIPGLTLGNPLGFCFIPVVSALDITGENYIGLMNANLTQGVLNAPETASVRWAVGDEQLTENTFHASLNLLNVGFIANEVAGNSVLNSSAFLEGFKYNFGNADTDFIVEGKYFPSRTSTFISNSITISNGSHLAINDNDRIGYTHLVDYEYLNLPNNSFQVYLSDLSCDDEELKVIVGNQGTLELGDFASNNRGGLHVWDGTLQVDGGIVKMENGSQITIEENGILLLNADLNTEMDSESRIELKGLLKTSGDVAMNIAGSLVIHPSARFELEGTLSINGVNINDDLIIVHGISKIEGSVSITNGKIRMIDDASLLISSPLGEQNNTASFSDVRLSQQDNTSTFLPGIICRNLASLSVENLKATNLSTRTIIQGSTIEIVDLAEVDIQDCHKAMTFNEIGELSIDDSKFRSTPQGQGDDLAEFSHGVAVANTPLVNISNTIWDGFGENNSFTPQLYALRLSNCSKVDILDSEFTNNAVGIESPKDKNEINLTNIFLTSTLLENNEHGIEMYGYSSPDPQVPYGGYLNMECVRLIDNQIGVFGEDILVQADYLMANQESNQNIFKPRNTGPSLVSTPSSVTFKITYTIHSYTDIPMRGNVWYDYSGTETIINANNTKAHVIKNPGVDASSTNQVFGCINEVFNDGTIGDPCLGCLISEDDEDCLYTFGPNEIEIASNYRTANAAIRDRDFALASEIFQPLANIAESSAPGQLMSKCSYQTHIARVFALPSAKSSTESIKDSAIDFRESTNSTLSIVPNPSSDFITIQGGKASSYVIFSSTGRKMATVAASQGTTIDVSSFESGLYFVTDTHSGETSKFIVLK